MALTDVDPDTGQQRRSWGGFALRMIGVGVAVYGVAASNVFAGPWWLAALTVLALAAMVSLMLLRLLPWSHWQGVAAAVMLLCGAIASPFANYLPLFFVVVGGIVLVGQPRIRLRSALTVTALGAAVLSAGALSTGASGWTLFAVMAGVGAVALGGVNRRQSHERDRQDRELVARSRELERRSQELITQTELTRNETARVAALQERGRIARDIHDVLAHSLGGLVVQLDAAEALLTERGDVEGAAARLRASRSLAVEGLQEARKAVNELREPTVGEVDLVAALTPLVRGPVGDAVGAALDVVGPVRPVAGPVASALIAITREALTNVNKHAPGGPVAVTVLFEKGTHLTLEIGNPLPVHDGHLDHPLLSASGAGAGVPGMRHRLAEVGGTLRAGPHGRRWLVEAQVADARIPSDEGVTHD